jgi:serine/threonine protein kinase
LGAGSFAEVWKGVSQDKKIEVAMKFEVMVNHRPNLIQEVEVLAMLCNNNSQCPPQGVAQFLDFSQQGNFYCMVMEKLGHSLQDRIRMSSSAGKLSVQSTVLVAEQILQRIEFLHSKGIIHRDIKPENFMFGLGDRVHHVYIIDFGLSKAYRIKHKPKSIM